MNTQLIVWALSAAVTILSLIIGFIVKWNGDQDKRIGDIEKEHAKTVRHTAENYVRGHEIAEVKKAVGDLRVEMTGVVSELRSEMTHQVSELTKAVYQMMGQNSSK